VPIVRRIGMEKRSRQAVEWDKELSAKPGWEGLRIWWLVSREETGTRGVVMNVVDFPPQTAHEVHRHDNSPEICYIESGSGLLTSDRAPVRIRGGEVAVFEAGEWHGFYNDTDEIAKMVTFWAGVDRYSDLGYEVYPDWKRTLELNEVSA
jgi:quercetin dioxygenase-like cupin family protein